MEAVHFSKERMTPEILVERVVDKTADPMPVVPQIQSRKKSLAPRDLFQRYFFEAKQYKLLTREEERDLAIKVKEKNDPEAAYKLARSNLRLVVKIALDFQKYWPQNLLDLIQEGNLGLIQSVKKFDPYRGTKFSYYAAFWIRAYMLKYIMDNFRLIKIGTTQNQRKLFFNLGKERDKLVAQGLDLQTNLVAERLHVKEEEVIEMAQRLGGRERSLDSPLYESNGESYADQLPDKNADIEEELSRRQRQQIFSKKIIEFRKQLSGREADIFDKRLIAEKPVTLQNLGHKYDISRERVRQIQENIIRKMKDRFSAEIPDFEEDYADISQ